MWRLAFIATISWALGVGDLAQAAANASAIATSLRIARNGLPEQIIAARPKARTLLAHPMQLELREGNKALPLPALAPEEPNRFTTPRDTAGLFVNISYGQDLYPFAEIRVGNNSGEKRRLMLTLSLPVRPEARHVFVPASERAHVALRPDDAQHNYVYPGGTALPLAQLYSPEQDWGLVVFEELGLYVEPWQIEIKGEKRAIGMRVSFPLVLEPQESARRQIYFAATQGDWRPALGAVLAQFPQAFVPAHPEARALDGPFVCSGSTPSDEEIAEWRRQGCKVVEIHCTFPFYGEYVPAAEPWTPLVDDTWHTLKKSLKPEEKPVDSDWRGIIAVVQRHKPPDMTKARINDYIARLQAQGLKGLIYFNPTEAWAPWAAEKFREDVRYDAQGRAIPAWLESSAMIPDVERRWGRYILGQLQAELAAFPNVNGVFFDQSAAGGHELTRLCYEGTKFVRARGGLCWWNGPYNMELAALADGLMTEGGGSEAYRQLTEIIQYYGIAGKPIVSLGPAMPAAYAEMLAHGVQVQPVGPGQEALRERWAPLFAQLRGRHWILTAKALEPISGFVSNIYRVPSGNIVVTIVPERVWEREPEPAYNVPVAVRVPEQKEIRGAYLLTPDWRGWHKLPFQRQGQTLRMIIPRIRWAALVVLARTGVFAALEGPMHIVAGEKAKARFVVDNWTSQSVQADLRLKIGERAQALKAAVAPGASAAVGLEIGPVAPQQTTWPIACEGTLLGTPLPSAFELAVEPPVILSATAAAEMRDDEEASLRVNILSHLPQGTTLTLILRSRIVKAVGRENEDVIACLTPRPEICEAHVIRLRPLRAGMGRIVIAICRGTEIITQCEKQLNVLATALAPEALSCIQSATLEAELFGSDGGPYAEKPVRINGMPIGNLPTGGGDAWRPISIPLPSEVLETIQARNSIEIDNNVSDCFKIRNLRLRLTLRGGIETISTTATGVYTAGADWLYAEGKRFPLGETLRGIVVELRIDPSRKERYDWFFGRPQSAQLVLEAAGSDGGIYAHKPVRLNGVLIGDLPPTPSAWTEIVMPLPMEALKQLGARNIVQIENCEPPDAFKIRRLRLEMINTAGERWRSNTDEGPYTSCSWQFAEGKIGSPIVVELSFPEPAL